jgi:hypothetical protein
VPTTSPAGYDDIERWLANLQSVPQTGEFPKLTGYEQVKQDYDNLLRTSFTPGSSS